MLEPETRELLMDVLRPPDGMRMDMAVGTTYTLDLDALLLAPLSFAMFDWIGGVDGPTDTQATLEALRRHANNTTLFCQDGMIGLPREYQPLMLHLEDVVIPVSAPRPHGIFHPKVWVVRYVAESGQRLWRAAILSRNLTFAASWDTVVVLEGSKQLEQHRPGGPLARFLLELVELGGTRLDKRRKKEIRGLAEEIRHVRFTAPEGFERTGVWFLPFGLGISTPWKMPPEGRSRTLVVSPFLGADALTSLASHGPVNDIVISRPEELDRLPPEAIEGWDCYVLAAGQSEVQPGAEEVAPEIESELRGLHAKLVIFERGKTSTVLTGSLNVTNAALHNNIELMAWMNGPTSEVGITAFMGDGKKASGPAPFGRMLEAYIPSHTEDDDDDAREEMRRDLDRARVAISRLDLTAHVSPTEPSTGDRADEDAGWRFALRVRGRADMPAAVTSVSVWRLTSQSSDAIPLDTQKRSQELDFGIVAEPAITAFFAVEVRVERKGKRDSATFLLRTALVGAPEGRAERMLARALQSRDAVIRYLQFLLAETSEDLRDLMEGNALLGNAPATARANSSMTFGLTERLLEVLVSDPDRLEHVERLLTDLRHVDDGALLPEGFEDIWAAIDEVRRESPSSPSRQRRVGRS